MHLCFISCWNVGSALKTLRERHELDGSVCSLEVTELMTSHAFLTDAGGKICTATKIAQFMQVGKVDRSLSEG